jgi:hypothetical protein
MSKINYTIECLPEDISVRGNACVSGDKAHDRQVEDDIIKQLNDGNEWAWCTVRVTAELEGFKGVAYLGACSYTSEAEFKASEYYNDMCIEAREMLRDSLAEAKLCGDEVGKLLNSISK